MRRTLGSRSKWSPARYKRERFRPSLRLFRLLSFLCGLAVLLYAVDARYRPLVKAYALNQSRLMSTLAINRAVERVLEADGTKYEDLIRVDKGDDGSIKSLESNIVAINLLKAAVTGAVVEELGDKNTINVKIPLGTLLGSDFLSGRGPLIPLKIGIKGTALTTMESRFQSAGINQTSHQILMNIQVLVFCAIPGFYTSTTVDSTFMIAETILVGEVPQVYMNLGGVSEDLVGKLFDTNGDS